MSSSIIAINGRPNSYALKEYICDSIDDVAKLPKYGVFGSFDDSKDFTINNPCSIGSTALVCDDGNGSCAMYILSPSNEWKSQKWQLANFPTDEYINSSINTALEVIENGTY